MVRIISSIFLYENLRFMRIFSNQIGATGGSRGKFPLTSERLSTRKCALYQFFFRKMLGTRKGPVGTRIGSLKHLLENRDHIMQPLRRIFGDFNSLNQSVSPSPTVRSCADDKIPWC